MSIALSSSGNSQMSAGPRSRPLRATSTGRHSLAASRKRKPEDNSASTSPRTDTSGTHVWLVLMKAYRSMARHAERSLGAADMGFSEFTILEALLSKGPLKVNDIGRRINLTSGSITTAIDRLEGRGLVKRSVDESDGRARLVSLTPSGRSLITKMFGSHKQRMDAAAESLTRAERK